MSVAKLDDNHEALVVRPGYSPPVRCIDLLLPLPLFPVLLLFPLPVQYHPNCSENKGMYKGERAHGDEYRVDFGVCFGRFERPKRQGDREGEGDSEDADPDGGEDVGPHKSEC